jgi:hypothetical protein
VEDFVEKVEVYQEQHPAQEVIPVFLSLGGFTAEALAYCKSKEIGVATKIKYIQEEWSS